MESKQEPKAVQRERVKGALIFCVALAIGIGVGIQTGNALFILFDIAVCAAAVWIYVLYWKKMSGPVVTYTGVCLDNDKHFAPLEIGKHIITDKRTYLFDIGGKLLTLHSETPLRFARGKAYKLYLPQTAVKETSDGIEATALSSFETVAQAKAQKAVRHG